MLPEALREAAHTHVELAAIGLSQPYLVINGVLPAPEPARDDLAAAICRRERAALAAMPDALRALPCDQVGLKPFDMVGAEALHQLFCDERAVLAAGAGQPVNPPAAHLSELVDDIAADGHGLVMLMGKGGVGKTNIAEAVAVELAR